MASNNNSSNNNNNNPMKFVFVEEPPDELNCPVCFEILLEPYEIETCGHVVCKRCLDEIINKSITRNGRSALVCPKGREPFRKNEIRLNRHVQRFVKNNIKVFCSQKDTGCPWNGVLSNFKDHQKTCKYVVEKCTLSGCSQEIMRKDLEEHQTSTCYYRRVNCKHCQEEMSFASLSVHERTCDFAYVSCRIRLCFQRVIKKDLEKHESSECMYRKVKCEYCQEEKQIMLLKLHHLSCELFPLSCSNQGCVEKIIRRKFENHTKEECFHRLIDCSFKDIGCVQKVKGGLMEEHIQQSTHIHMMYMFHALKVKDKKIEAQSQKIEAQSQKIEQLEERIDKLCNSEESEIRIKPLYQSSNFPF